MPKDFSYSFKDLVCTDGHFGFTAYLDREVAKLALTRELSRADHDKAQEFARGVILGCGLKLAAYEQPIMYHKDTSLLWYVHVPGSRSDLGVNPDEIRPLERESLEESSRGRPLEYTMHNVDFMAQSHALFVLFSTWANFAMVLGRNR